MYCKALSTLTICFSVSVKEVTTPERRLVTERAYEMARPTSPGKRKHRAFIDTHQSLSLGSKR